MKTLFEIILVLGALGSLGQFILLALTFYRSYKTDKPATIVWEHHPR